MYSRAAKLRKTASPFCTRHPATLRLKTLSCTRFTRICKCRTTFVWFYIDPTSSLVKKEHTLRDWAPNLLSCLSLLYHRCPCPRLCIFVVFFLYHTDWAMSGPEAPSAGATTQNSNVASWPPQAASVASALGFLRLVKTTYVAQPEVYTQFLTLLKVRRFAAPNLFFAPFPTLISL